MTKPKVILLLISGALIAFATEAIRVAIVSASTGLTPLVFGFLPTRSLILNDTVMIILVALLGIAWVGYRSLRTIFEGFPLSIRDSDSDEPGYIVSWDGMLKPVRFFPFTLISEIDTIARGMLGGGGHQIRFRIRGRRIALTVAREDTSHEADRVVVQLQAKWSRSLGLDADIRKD